MNQIVTVMRFEVLKNRKKFFILLIFETILWFLSVLLPYLITNAPLPVSISIFMDGSLGNLTLLMIIIAAAYGGSLIADEFDKHTGFMLFPKVSKTRLFIGKFTSQYLLFALNLAIYYAFVLAASIVNYTDKIPNTFYYSFLFALLYAAVLFSFVILFSSFMKNTALVVIVSILLLFLGFSMITGILSLVLPQVEPLYDITYLGRVITSVFSFPNPRYEDITVPISATETFSMRTWISPLLNISAILMLVYFAIFIVIAYLLFLRRESKG